MCARPLSAAEKKERVDELCKHTGETSEGATKLLELSAFEVPAAMKLWAGRQGAIVLDDSDDDLAEGNDQNSAANSQVSPIDVTRIMNGSSYGRIVKMLKRITTLSKAAKLSLPRIVVVGSESSGKSSTIERIAGVTLFPRDVQICTRMPIKLSLITSDESDVGCAPTVTLKFGDKPDQVVSEAQAASAVAKLMAEAVPGGRGVTDQQLTIEVRKASVPTLDLIDLPGIVAASVEGEPADMMTRTRSITESYMRQPDTIVVVVVPANITRVRDSQAIQLVQECAKQEVTLGVLAKADLAHDPRYKQRKQASPYWELSQRLAGEADDMVALPNGWVAVKNRDTLVAEEEAAGLAMSAHAEREWFGSEASIPAAVATSQCGIDALLRKIDGLYTTHIKSTWVPQALVHLNQEMETVTLKIESLGPAPTSLTLEGVLSAFGNELAASGAALLQSKMYEEVRVSVIDQAWAALSPEEQIATNSKSGPPDLSNIVAKVRIQAELISALKSAEKPAVNLMKEAVCLAFDKSTSPLRLKRFVVLREAICDSVGELIKQAMPLFVESATRAIKLHYELLTGDHLAWHDHDARTRQVYLVTEVALRELIVPAMTKPADAIGAALEASAARDGDWGVAVGKHRTRSAQADANPAPTRSNGAHPLLEEACFAERAKLIACKHDLFIALSELNKI